MRKVNFLGYTQFLKKGTTCHDIIIFLVELLWLFVLWCCSCFTTPNSVIVIIVVLVGAGSTETNLIVTFSQALQHTVTVHMTHTCPPVYSANETYKVIDLMHTNT